VLVGCNTESSTAPTVAAAPTALAGTGDPITGNRSAFCQEKVAGILGTQPQYVKTGSPIIGADGSITIDATVNKGDEGIKSFRCRYDASGRFIDVLMS
jgi:hypothetical protein